MDRLFLFFARVVALVVGFIVACLVAACANLVLNSMIVPGGLAHIEARGMDLWLVVGLLGLAGLFGHASFLPSAILILFSEFARLRSWVIYMLGGGLIAGVVLVLAVRAEVAIALDPRHLAIDLVSGMLGGLAYWLVAGHRAGRWLPSQRQPSRPGEKPDQNASA